jgi:membrane protein YdbS with pleckstrin-like domain
MFCKQCGAEIEDDSTFCKNCGGSQKKDADGQAAPAPDKMTAAAGAAAKPDAKEDEVDGEYDIWTGSRSAKKYFWLYFGVFTLMALALVAALYINEEFVGKMPMGDSLKSKTTVIRFIPFFITLIFFSIVWSKAYVYTRKIRYRLTTQRFFIIYGILSRTMDELELVRVNDVVMKQTAWERLMNIGAVTIISNDETTPMIELINIPEPEKVKEHIRGASAKKRGRGLFVEHV